MTRYNGYGDEARLRATVEAGQHRELVGGLWEEMGTLQFEFLKSKGLQPHHTLIDIGCGALRAGVKIAPFLNPGNYYGIDVSPALLEAGQRELETAGASDRVPAGNLRATSAFDLLDFPAFNFGIAQSLFTHLPMTMVATCLQTVRPHFKADARLFATFFIAAAGAIETEHLDGVTSYRDHDPFSHDADDILKVARDCGWHVFNIGSWAHPRGQSMCEMVPL